MQIKLYIFVSLLLITQENYASSKVFDIFEYFQRSKLAIELVCFIIESPVF